MMPNAITVTLQHKNKNKIENLFLNVGNTYNILLIKKDSYTNYVEYGKTKRFAVAAQRIIFSRQTDHEIRVVMNTFQTPIIQSVF